MDGSGLGESIRRDRPTAKRPQEWTEHIYTPDNSNVHTTNENSDKKSLWQRLKNINKGKSNEEHQAKQKTDTPTLGIGNRGQLLNDTSDLKPRPMLDVGTPMRKIRNDNSIPKSQSQWQRAFEAISEMKKTELNQPKPMNIKQMDRKYEPVNESASASEHGRPKPASDDTDSFWLPTPRNSRPDTRRSGMEFWGAEDFCFDPINSVDMENIQDPSNWKL
ncbi:uncharacterized protein LOC125647114 isoform X2 [Ostrea edulis]|uniref:uncharacterized protein LOC125647114 isoform X2 n=1 Tax=Ostrea edulis TaxID=37623 RepID=UPI0024AF84F4|nr:uncharacterized protein LOC125647114 isoform X2 [Ostrea edulis]